MDYVLVGLCCAVTLCLFAAFGIVRLTDLREHGACTPRMRRLFFNLLILACAAAWQPSIVLLPLFLFVVCAIASSYHALLQYRSELPLYSVRSFLREQLEFHLSGFCEVASPNEVASMVCTALGCFPLSVLLLALRCAHALSQIALTSCSKIKRTRSSLLRCCGTAARVASSLHADIVSRMSSLVALPSYCTDLYTGRS